MSYRMDECTNNNDAFWLNLGVDKVVRERQMTTVSSKFPESSFPVAHSHSNSTQPSIAKRLKLNTSLLESTLNEVFGFRGFRNGQREIIQELLFHKRDCAVFWATGKGKSLCYQIPALVEPTNVALVISPLISLMQDQVQKLNSLPASEKYPLATYLGSAQINADAERKALKGEFRIIFVTPEKLLGAEGTFLNSLASNLQNRLCLFAIDEAHCVSEWGYDFRPDYRQVGRALRKHPSLRDIPILALTATAVPRVQQDIIESLHMRDPFVSLQSFDRKNLKIRVVPKPSGGITGAFNELVAKLRTSRDTLSIAGSKQSTIVYASTRAQVEEIALFLQKNIQNDAIQIEAYHAGLSPSQRTATHSNFLTGKTAVIVATVAFGMGIDKPDVRRIVHYGPPKTLEEYYQQIGRAGRDGLPAECVMYFSLADFDRYKNDFYLGGLEGKALKAVQNSMARFRLYALDPETCRRRALLEYFSEIPDFGDRCGTCDTCVSSTRHQSDAQRDFSTLGAKTVLLAVDSLKEQSLSIILKVISGKTVEYYRYKDGSSPLQVKQKILDSLVCLKKRYSNDYFRYLIAPLVLRGYIAEGIQTKLIMGQIRSWTTYKITPVGLNALMKPNTAILLPVPQSIREIEQEDEEKRQKILTQLQENGVKLDKVPLEEIETGDGEVIRAYKKWNMYLETLRKSGKHQWIPHLNQLFALLEKWRAETAVKYVVAPASVISEHILIAIAYTTATLPPGMKMESNSLLAAGVRSRETATLASELSNWIDKFHRASTSEACIAKATDRKMVLTMITPSEPWQYAVYKPQKKTGLATWESSYIRFLNGDSVQAIAMSPINGRQPIQVTTVVGHILDALVHGRKVDLRQLGRYASLPTESEWKRLQTAESVTRLDPTADPSSTGKYGEKFTLTEFLRPIVGDRIADLKSAERSEEEKQLFSYWCERLRCNFLGTVPELHLAGKTVEFMPSGTVIEH